MDFVRENYWKKRNLEDFSEVSSTDSIPLKEKSNQNMWLVPSISDLVREAFFRNVWCIHQHQTSVLKRGLYTYIFTVLKIKNYRAQPIRFLPLPAVCVTSQRLHRYGFQFYLTFMPRTEASKLRQWKCPSTCFKGSAGWPAGPQSQWGAMERCCCYSKSLLA